MALPNPNERRLTERYAVEQEVDLVLSNGSILPVSAINLSITGMQFVCDGWVANEIEPRGIHNHPLDKIQLKVVADLNKNKKLYAQCRIISARRLAQDSYLIGMAFIEFENGSEPHLIEHISSLPAAQH